MERSTRRRVGERSSSCRRYAAMLGILCVIWIGVRSVTTQLVIAKDLEPTFDEEPAGRAVTLELWDSRFS
jgi:hypothetical protein